MEVTLSPGDLLYIPPRAYHVALPSMPRMAMSIPFISFDSSFYLQEYVSDFNQVINGESGVANIIERASKIDALPPRLKEKFL